VVARGRVVAVPELAGAGVERVSVEGDFVGQVWEVLEPLADGAALLEHGR